ncbi:hypothetical protein [Arcobacter vandammei]|uniref:hypothetical protein n=1 Tax=Arcobacter vandammei TaxID=2782243 RepID=UPI0018E062C6|nr:hypothetical protein [Arcobacter vandammei]
MILALSGEGKTDLGELDFGTDEFIAGSMYMIVDKIIEKTYDYSPYNTSKENIKYIPEAELSKRAKTLKPIRLPGKSSKKETAYFYKNARALAIITKEIEADLAILFRDSDGTNSSNSEEWKDKYDSILRGFEVEEFFKGVAMLPKPKSEAWLLCALKNNYQNCNTLENESGNDNSPNSLKKQLESYALSDEQICDKIKSSEIDIEKIEMDSFKIFKQRLLDVLD